MFRVDGDEQKLVDLRRQFDLLTLLHDRHVTWGAGTDDSVAKEMHRKIAAAFQQMGQDYHILLDRYNEITIF